MSSSFSENDETVSVHSLTQRCSFSEMTESLIPLRLNARSSLAPTHLMSHRARDKGTLLLTHCSSSDQPLIPCGIVRLSLRRGKVSSARSRSQATFFASVRVTRGGGLKVDSPLTLPSLHWSARTFENTAERCWIEDFCLM